MDNFCKIQYNLTSYKVKIITKYIRKVFRIKFKAKILIAFFLLVGSIFSKEIASIPEKAMVDEAIKEEIIIEQKKFKPELRVVTSIYTTHTNDNDIYNNNTNLMGIEYRPLKDFGINLGYFKNSFNNDSYVLSAGKYLRPSEKLEDFYFTMGVGIVKGYKKVNYIYHNDEVIKKSKFNTNIGGDFIIGASVGLGYDITDYFSINVSYVGAFVSAITLKLY